MAGSRATEEIMRFSMPHTFNSLQNLTVAIASLIKSQGKRTWFGRDKSVIAYSKFLAEFKSTLHAMVLDGLITEATPPADVIAKIQNAFDLFSRAFPNWQDVYGFVEYFFVAKEDEALAIIERLRGAP